MHFSDLASQFNQPSNRLYQVKQARLNSKKPILDLISGNVNSQGLYFPLATYEKALRKGARAARTYQPDSLGQAVARRAVSDYYAADNIKVPADQVVITPGTSLSYWYAFKTLANTGDEVLSPTPSYPLFDAIASLSGVQLKPYRLLEGKRWSIDLEHVSSQITHRTKALILISPHNPTGAVATMEEIAELCRIAGQRGIAILSDEVFSPFLFTPGKLPRPAGSNAPLVFTLNGLSKMLALPGSKLGWMAVTGDPSSVRTAMNTLAMISDTFLPVHEAAQFALPELLRQSVGFQARYSKAIQERFQVARAELTQSGEAAGITPEGGFFWTLPLSGTRWDEEELAIRLLNGHGILTHPGYFYDMEDQHLVFSFVSKPQTLRQSLRVLLSEIGR